MTKPNVLEIAKQLKEAREKATQEHWYPCSDGAVEARKDGKFHAHISAYRLSKEDNEFIALSANHILTLCQAVEKMAEALRRVACSPDEKYAGGNCCEARKVLRELGVE